MAQKLIPSIKQQIKSDELLIALIAKGTDKRISTVERWIKEDHIMLTTSVVLDLIRKHLSLAKNTELLQEKELEAA